MCPANYGIEDIEQFLLLCSFFDVQRKIVLAGVDELIRSFVQITNLSNLALKHLLLYGDYSFTNNLNMNIIELTLRFIREAVCKGRKGMGMIRFLFKYVSCDALDHLYKLFARPHLDYGDIICLKYDPCMTQDFTERL